jgi:hypothetical protein
VPAHPCTAVFEGLEKGNVPHFMPGENPFLKEIRGRYGLPPDAPTGGPDTMYPEFARRLRPSLWSGGKGAGRDDAAPPAAPAAPARPPAGGAR